MKKKSEYIGKYQFEFRYLVECQKVLNIAFSSSNIDMDKAKIIAEKKLLKKMPKGYILKACVDASMKKEK